MNTALVIGLGTSGLHIIEECQQLCYQFTGKNKPEAVRYLYFETNVNQQSQSTAMGQTDIQPVFISLQNMGAAVHQLLVNNQLDHSWIPPVDAALSAGDGAGGNSSYGRLAFWINYHAVRNSILQNWQQIKGNDQTYIFIVGTLTGGTCSGALIDMAYLIRAITGSDKIFGLFLTPSYQQLAQSGSDSLFYNYFSAITAIKHYSDSNNPYDVTFPDGSHIHNNKDPFYQCYFISQDYTSFHAPMAAVNELYKVAGLHIYSRIHALGEFDTNNGQPIPTFSETIDRRLLDMKANVNGYKFSTFGTKLIYFPKELLKELFGIKLSKQFLERWIDTENFIDNHNDRKRIDEHKIRIQRQSGAEFESRIIDCLNIVDGQNTSNDTNLLKEIENNNVTTLLKRNYQESSPSAYIYQLFKTDNDTNHFALVNNNRFTIRDQFIEQIYQALTSNLGKYNNLEIGRLVLRTIVTSIDNTLKFWEQEYKIDGRPEIWNSVLQENIKQMMSDKTLPTLLLSKEAYFKEELVNILMLSKIHVAVRVLKQIKEIINTGQEALISQQRKELPTIQKLTSIIAIINSVIRNVNYDTELTLERRENEIRANLTTNTPNFDAIFLHGSLENDIENLETNYRRNNQNNLFSYINITDGRPLWEYLEYIDRQRLYFDCLSNSVRYVNETLTDLNNSTILDIIRRLQNTPADTQWIRIRTFITDNETNIRQKLPGLEGLRANIDQFQPHQCLKLIYLNADTDGLSPLMQNYNIRQDDCSCELPGLNDAIIIFQEYGYMGSNTPTFDPTVNTGINKTVCQRIANNIDYENNDANNPNVFIFKRRVPYLTEEQFKQYLQNL